MIPHFCSSQVINHRPAVMQLSSILDLKINPRTRTYSLPLALASSILANPSPCYHGPEALLDSRFVSCRNNENNFGSCCMLGDYCLQYGACFNLNSGMTYIAGCTDPTYAINETVCPCPTCTRSKPLTTASPRQATLNSPFLTASPIQGLGYCSQGVWKACSGPGQQVETPERTSPDSCNCSSDQETAIVASSSSLGVTALLPQNTNNPIIFISQDPNGNLQTLSQGSIPGVESTSIVNTTSTSNTGSGIPTTLTPSSANFSAFHLFPLQSNCQMTMGQALGLSLGLCVSIGVFLSPLATVLALRAWRRHRKCRLESRSKVDREVSVEDGRVLAG